MIIVFVVVVVVIVVLVVVFPAGVTDVKTLRLAGVRLWKTLQDFGGRDSILSVCFF